MNQVIKLVPSCIELRRKWAQPILLIRRTYRIKRKRSDSRATGREQNHDKTIEEERKSIERQHILRDASQC